MNILILSAGHSLINEDGGGFPICLTEIGGKPLIELIFNACSQIVSTKYIVALRENDITKYHVDKIIELLNPKTAIVPIKNNTQGAACTALLAINEIEEDAELLILNGNEYFNDNYKDIIQNFRGRSLDAGVVIFKSFHPRYSFVCLDQDSLVIEAAEKKPISNFATVGFYWFAKSEYFISSVKKMIVKDASIDGIYYIAPSLNELILEQKKIGVYEVDSNKYQPIKSMEHLRKLNKI